MEGEKMPWIWGILMPHAPILVPEIGKEYEREVEKTQTGMNQLLDGIASLANRKKGANLPQPGSNMPDCILLLSPHHTYAQGSLYINSATTQHGSLQRFGAPNVNYTVRTEQRHIKPLTDHLKEHQIPVVVHSTDSLPQDHGSIVPLYYLANIFPERKLPPIIIANPVGLTREQAYNAGKALASFKSDLRWALLASGDLSHRLTRSAPSGYSPSALVFDVAAVEALKKGLPDPLFNLTPKLIAEAGECGMRSILMLLGLAQEPLTVHSYDGPVGIGYCTAFWAGQHPAEEQTKDTTADLKNHTPKPECTPTQKKAADPDTTKMQKVYPALAREAVRMFLQSGEENSTFTPPIPRTDLTWQDKAGCFVSIKTLDGRLRGCMGTILSTQPSLAKEIIANAITAASRDPRFPPMRKHELDNVVFSVDVLGQPEPVKSIEDLDEKQWGVIVTKGRQRGLLLPDIAGVDSVEQQLNIAAQKAGLDSWHDATIERFSVTRYKEKDE